MFLRPLVILACDVPLGLTFLNVFILGFFILLFIVVFFASLPILHNFSRVFERRNTTARAFVNLG